MSIKSPFKYAEGKRIELTNAQQRKIKSLYRDAVKEIRAENKTLTNFDSKSEALRRVYLNAIEENAKNIMNHIDYQTQGIVNNNMEQMVRIVCDNNQTYLSGLGYKNYISNPQIQKDVVSRIVTGKIYDNTWNLSNAIWGDNANKNSEISKIVAKGIAQGKSVYDISKDLEKYVNPDARKDWEWSKNFPGSRRVVDYNAQRLSRTMVAQAYQQAFVRMTRNNPFIDAYKWVTSGGHNVCPICIEREEADDYGLGPGIYPKDKLPIDHPNGMCTFDVVVSMTDKEISEAIADWYLGEGDEAMNKKLTKFANDLSNF